MGLNKEGLSCTLCHAYLFDEDDVVYCPVCGAPHHRECYNSISHCALEELHGTENQYDRLKEKQEKETPPEDTRQTAEGYITCRMCGEKYDFNNNACPRCNAPNAAKAGGSFISFDFLGGVPAEYDIGDGVTANEAKRFVVANTPRYIPKFKQLSKTKKNSWNWMAFLFPAPWFFSRKMYKNGLIAAVLSVVSTLFTLPFVRAFDALNIENTASYAEIAAEMYKNMPDFGTSVIIATFIASAISLLIKIISGIYGDYLYKKHTVESVKKIKAESSDIDFDYRKRGGVNMFAFLLCYMALQYLPMILSIFVK